MARVIALFAIFFFQSQLPAYGNRRIICSYYILQFCKERSIDFLAWRVWIGLWVFIITLVVLAAEGSYIVKYITRFTEEVFAILISLIFINEVIQKLIEVSSVLQKVM